MSNFFNADRFSRLFIKHSQEYYKSYLMSLAVLIGVMVMGGSFLIFLIKAPIEPEFQILIYIWILLLGGTMFTSTIFAEYGDNKKVIARLSLPASHFEKYLVAWMYSFLIVFLVITGSFYLVMLFLLNIKHFPNQQPELFNLMQKPGELQIPLLFFVIGSYACMHSLMFYGAIFFKKLHFIKTAFLFFIILAISVVGNKFLLDLMLHKDTRSPLLLTRVGFWENGHYFTINLEGNKEGYAFGLYVVVALLFWIAAYYRLKEKQA